MSAIESQLLRRGALAAAFTTLIFVAARGQNTAVRQLATDVYFWQGDHELKQPANCTWIVFKDYVLVIDANFPGPAREIIGLIRKTTDKPIWCKLSPNAGDVVAVGQAAEAAGANALVVSNTILGLKIDTNTFKPAIGNKFGGLSGPGIKPIIVRMVYQCAKAVKIPIIGCGGIVKVEDVVEYLSLIHI